MCELPHIPAEKVPLNAFSQPIPTKLDLLTRLQAGRSWTLIVMGGMIMLDIFDDAQVCDECTTHVRLNKLSSL